MPHSASAMKRLKQNKVHRIRNKSHKNAMRTQIKKLLAAIESKSPDLDKVLSDTFRSIDKVASKGIIHKNTANRLKSRLSLRKNRELASS